MVSKDQAIGWVIFLVCAIVAIVYLIALILPGEMIQLLNLTIATETLRLYLVAVPVLIAFIAILAIGAWIGWTMATTPPPKPIEEIEAEMETEAEEEKAEEEEKEKKKK
jgi:predicted DNA-binding transcriptional regulator